MGWRVIKNCLSHFTVRVWNLESELFLSPNAHIPQTCRCSGDGVSAVSTTVGSAPKVPQSEQGRSSAVCTTLCWTHWIARVIFNGTSICSTPVSEVWSVLLPCILTYTCSHIHSARQDHTWGYTFQVWQKNCSPDALHSEGSQEYWRPCVGSISQAVSFQVALGKKLMTSTKPDPLQDMRNMRNLLVKEKKVSILPFFCKRGLALRWG